MRKRIAASTLALCLALLAAPAMASAANVITTAPIKVRGYQMTVVASDARQGSVTVLFSRNAKRSTQAHTFTFNKRVKVTGKSIRAQLGRYGQINLRFGALRNLKSRGKLPTGCKGRAARSRIGTMTGRLRFVADRNFFRTISTKSIRATVTSGGRLNCSGSGAGNGGDGEGDGGGFTKGEPMLTLTKRDRSGMLTMTATKNSVSVVKMEAPKQSAPAQVVRSIFVSGPRRLVVFPGASATVNSRAPFIAGTGRFTPTQNLGVIANGNLGGNLAAKFASIGRQSLSGEATLLNP